VVDGRKDATLGGRGNDLRDPSAPGLRLNTFNSSCASSSIFGHNSQRTDLGEGHKHVHEDEDHDEDRRDGYDRQCARGIHALSPGSPNRPHRLKIRATYTYISPLTVVPWEEQM
jgi:hypothetical protein